MSLFLSQYRELAKTELVQYLNVAKPKSLALSNKGTKYFISAYNVLV